MRSFRPLLWLALAVSLGCARLDPHETLTPRGFDSFPELVALQRAVNAWNEAVPKLHLRLTAEGGDWVIERSHFEEKRYGNTSRFPRALIRIDPDRLAFRHPGAPYKHLTNTAMHEIGHALGLQDHLPGGAPDLMRGQHSGITCVDARTLAWLLRERPELKPGARETCR